jgi:hypothetical protein
MINCKNCGKQIKLFSKYGLEGSCVECWPIVSAQIQEKEALRREEEKQAKLKVESAANDCILSLANAHIEGEKLKAFGIAYWDTAGSVVTSFFDKIIGGALFGGIGVGMTGKSHHFGVIAVTDTKLQIIDMGSIVGESIEAKDCINVSMKKSVKAVSIKELQFSVLKDSLTLAGGVRLKARFPSLWESGNPEKAKQVAVAIESGGAKAL